MSVRSSSIAAQLPQTNLQLFGQMRTEGYSADDLALVARAYLVATKLFANRFRPCGRPFVAHLVGTSAALVWLKRPIPTVVAALLHAAYQEGDFPNSLEGMTPRKRADLTASIGAEAEALVAAYTLGSRSLTGLKASHARFKQLTLFERDILLMQLANELDDYRELAGNHAANAEERLDVIRQCGQQQVEMAEWLGHPKLARALHETFEDALAAADMPAPLVSQFANGYAILPASCRPQFNIVARRLGRKVRNRLRRHLGVG